MAENTYKIDNKKRSLFRLFEEKFRLNTDFADGVPVRYVPHVLFVTFLCILYIGNSHYAETSQRKLNKLKVEVEDLRAEYTTLKSDYMHAKLQSEVAKRVKAIGLEESEIPPYKLILEESEY